MDKKHLMGFTLVELLIVVAIIAIIAAIAFPSYQAQVQKSRRTEAKTALANIQLAQERAYTVNGTYAADAQTLDLSSGLTAVNANTITTEQGFYNITLTVAAGNTTYTANAVGVGAQAGDTDCAWMAMDHLGTKTATNTAKCW